MKIIHKDKWNFWPFKRYSFYLESKDESLIEVSVSKQVWEKFNIGDSFNPCDR
jgi:hypothetical protein